MQRYFLTRLVILLLACLAPSSLRAEVIFTNFGPGDDFDHSAGFLVGGFGPRRNSFAEALKFTVPSGSSYQFQNAVLPMHWAGGNNKVSVSLFEDFNGLPGAVLETVVLNDVLQLSPTLITVTSAVRPALTPNAHYWLVASANSADELVWQLNVVNDFSNGTNFAFNPLELTGTWEHYSTVPLRPAFRVEGIPVPEPTAGALLSLGMGLALTLPGRAWLARCIVQTDQ